ncbi:Uncharacterised protein [Mycobacteroides abscessus subsp. abscessus]|nr:Uncharacterised protein [Mycobacteroides abscessus subsp. abscessus]
MLGQPVRSKPLLTVTGIVTGALLGIGLGIALFLYESKCDMEASY